MLKNKKMVEDELEVNMTPMLDIVFIMLIFFIVTAVFVREPGVDVQHPTASTANDIKRISTIVGITADNTIWIDKNEIELGEVRSLVAKFKQANPKGKVVIRADKNSHSGIVVAVVEQLKHAGVDDISLSTRDGV